MISAKETILNMMRELGAQSAKELQKIASDLSGTELYEREDSIPDFKEAIKVENMLNRPAGFVCRSSAGRIVYLIQPYDSVTYDSEPENLPAQWGFKWSTNPKKALPFVASATSPYNTGECCTYEGYVWKSGMDSNTHPPGSVGAEWEKLGTIEEIIGTNSAA